MYRHLFAFPLLLCLTYDWVNHISVEAEDVFEDKTDDNFLKTCVDTHNYYRSLHNSPPLVLDPQLIDYSKNRTNYISTGDALNSADIGLDSAKFGQNSFWMPSDGKIPDCSLAVKLFYNEIVNYNFSFPGYSYNTVHFSAVVWRATTNLGCARLFSNKTGTYIICNYTPPPNYPTIDAYVENVWPLKQ